MNGRGNDSVVSKGMDRADPTKPEAPVAKRQQAFRRRWSVGLSAGTMVLLLLVVLVLLYRTSQWLLTSSRPVGF
jgi:hypothetical protein